MAKSKAELREDFDAFIKKHGGKYKEWCFGTSDNPRAALFNVHKFKTSDRGLYRQAANELQAAEVAEFFTDFGAKGDNSFKRGATYVYAYKIAPHTKP